MELDKRDLFLNRPKVTLHKSMKTCIKITKCRHAISLFQQSGVGWARAMDSPREKTSTSHLSRTPMFNKEKALDYLIILKIVARETSHSRSGLFQRGSTGYAG